jgi:hypothetical protein
MEKPAGRTPLSKARRMEVFRELVEAQDRQETVLQSREDVALRFGITKTRLARIEQEGLDADWPPL